MIDAIKFASVPVSDQDRALAFYTEKLGFEVLTDSPFDDKQRWIELGLPNGDARLVLFTPDGQEDRIGSFMNIVFTSKNVERTHDQLKDKGVLFDGPPKKQDWGTFVLFKDPDGNTFCISGP